MSRKGNIKTREINPDPKFNSKLVAKFINAIMVEGKKGLAETIVYEAFDLASKKIGKGPLEVFHEAIGNVKPSVEVKSRRVGGATYQVPVEIRRPRQESLAMRWIINYSRDRGERNMKEKLAAELVDAFNKRGSAMKKREDTHKMADANKAFAHYRW